MEEVLLHWTMVAVDKKEKMMVDFGDSMNYRSET